jgi:probable F420-dependent oxidoreductase
VNLGRVGIWSFLGGDSEAVGQAAREIEAAGYSALWIPGGAGGDVLDRCDAALTATNTLHVATGILNIWKHDAAEVAATSARLAQSSGDRFVLGLGVSHSMLIGEDYVAPLTKMESYLDELDTHAQPAAQRVLAALRPRMLKLSATRAAGAHPYFVPPEHTAVARAELGTGPVLAPEQMVLLETDASTARQVARESVGLYLNLPNYTNNLRRLGYSDDELAPPGSDRVIDAIVAWGTPATIATRVQAHLDAGADHVCVQVLGVPRGPAPVDQWRTLAAALV